MKATTKRPDSVAEVTSLKDAVGFCLQRVGGSHRGLCTLVLSGHAFSSQPRSAIWEVLNDVERWPDWSPLHASTRWVVGESLAISSKFEQTLQLGFPAGESTETVTLAFAEEGRHAGWEGEKGGIRSCHIWVLLERSDGGAEVINVEAFSGWPIALIKPLVARRWRRQFQTAADTVGGRTS